MSTPSGISARTKLLTAEEAAKVLRIGRSKLYQLLAAQELASIKIGRSRRVRMADVEDYIERLASCRRLLVPPQRGSATPTHRSTTPPRDAS